mmetsp:Transcript_54738/g.65986  ORF Transcript_54738/g.65986 Transcript_54738/m.65986 type:complete len:118 (-) Transcript_54738:493-846(-)
MLQDLMDTDLIAHADGDNARDLSDRRSVTSNVWLFMGVIIAWIVKKQPDTLLHSNGSEVRSLFASVLHSNIIRKRFADIGYPIKGGVPTAEDNQSTIKEVLKDRLTPAVRHIDVLIT